MRIFIILLLLNFYSFGYTAEVDPDKHLEVAAPSAGDKGDRKRRMSTESDLRDRGDRKKRAAPVECTIEEANSLAEWFCKSHLSNWGGSFYGKYYSIRRIETGGGVFVCLRPTDSEANCKFEGTPAMKFEIINSSAGILIRYLLEDLQARYLKQDMVSQMTDVAFQRAGIFPGLTFFNMVVKSKIKENQGHLDKARKLLPNPYNAEFTKPEMPSDIRPYSFFRAFSLYKATYTSEISSSCHYYLSTAIRDLQPFYNAEIADSEITAKHGVFIKSLEDNLFHTNRELKLKSDFVTQLIGLYKHAVARLGDQGLNLLLSVQSGVAASLINLTKVNEESMDAFLARFEDYLSKQNESIEQLKIEQLR